MVDRLKAVGPSKECREKIKSWSGYFKISGVTKTQLEKVTGKKGTGLKKIPTDKFKLHILHLYLDQKVMIESSDINNKEAYLDYFRELLGENFEEEADTIFRNILGDNYGENPENIKILFRKITSDVQSLIDKCLTK